MVTTGEYTSGSKKFSQRVIGGSLQYSTGGFMPVIVISGDGEEPTSTLSRSQAYVMYDTTVTASTALYYSVDALAVNRNGN
jgi:hypothetical protein